MHYIIILDDDDSHNNFMKKKLELLFSEFKFDFTMALDTTYPKEVLEYSAAFKARNNIYLLDVNVQDKINGIDVAGIIRSQEASAYIVFISAHPEYVMPSLKTKIFDYLIKPISFDMLEACIRSIIRDYSMLNNNQASQMLNIKSGFELYTIPLKEIIYFEKYGHLLVIHTVTGKFESSESLESIEQKLDKRLFFRSHKSYLINLTYISRIVYPDNVIYLKNGEVCPVSKRNKKELKLVCSTV